MIYFDDLYRVFRILVRVCEGLAGDGSELGSVWVEVGQVGDGGLKFVGV
ncbi:MAG: hypothetical protein V7742_14035 [Halioglobus sp.]